MRTESVGASWAVAIALLGAVVGGAWAEPAHKLIARGNAAFASGNYDEALTLYDEASVEFPESAQVYFNRGTVFYKQEDYEKASEAFKEAALRSKEPQLGARAKFNLGNAAFRRAQRQKDSDLKKAIERCRESVSYYQEARDLDRDYKQAAENIEIVRLFMKVLLDEQQKKQEEQQQNQEQEENLVSKLKKLLERQQALRAENESLAQTKPENGEPAVEETWKNSLGELSGKQRTLADDTGAVLEEIQQTRSQIEQQAAAAGQDPDPSQPRPQTQPQPTPEEMQSAAKKLGEAERHTTNAINSERGAASQLNAGAQTTAGKNQEQAAHYLEEAIKALAGDEEQQPQQGEGEQDQDDQQPKGEDQKQEQSGEGEQNKEEEQQENEQGEQENEEQKGESQAQNQESQEPTEEEKAQARREKAEDILKEARENQKKRRPQRPGQIAPVDRDW